MYTNKEITKKFIKYIPTGRVYYTDIKLYNELIKEDTYKPICLVIDLSILPKDMTVDDFFYLATEGIMIIDTSFSKGIIPPLMQNTVECFASIDLVDKTEDEKENIIKRYLNAISDKKE